jgi:hypothetical protein
MKTKILFASIIVVLMLNPFSSRAQISYGSHHGLTISTLSKIGDLYDNKDLSYAYTGGIFTTFPLKNNFSIQPEINYLAKGRMNEGLGISSTTEVDYKFHYLQVPLLLRYSAQATDKCNIFLNLGPYASALLKTETKSTPGTENLSSEEDAKKADIGLLMGGGFSIPVRKINLEFDLRYEMGFTPLDNQPDDFRTKALSLTAGIRF